MVPFYFAGICILLVGTDLLLSRYLSRNSRNSNIIIVSNNVTTLSSDIINFEFCSEWNTSTIIKKSFPKITSTQDANFIMAWHICSHRNILIVAIFTRLKNHPPMDVIISDRILHTVLFNKTQPALPLDYLNAWTTVF